MITAHPHFYLPNLSTFQNKNTFYGSLDELRFRVAYQEDEAAGKQFHVCTWPGPYCLADSEVTWTKKATRRCWRGWTPRISRYIPNHNGCPPPLTCPDSGRIPKLGA